jgi:hypothetical protein
MSIEKIALIYEELERKSIGQQYNQETYLEEQRGTQFSLTNAIQKASLTCLI